MLKRIKENKKGFTLAELLIVVAIIAVLVAIALPAFSSSLDKARVQVEAANARSFHGECMVAYMDEDADAIAATSLTDALVATIDGVTYSWYYDDTSGDASIKVSDGKSIKKGDTYTLDYESELRN